MAENNSDISADNNNPQTPEKENAKPPQPTQPPPRTVASAFAKVAANQAQNQPKPQSPTDSQPQANHQDVEQVLVQSQPKPQTPNPLQVLPQTPISAESLKEAIAAPIDRRTFIKWSAVGWTAFAAVMGGYATMVMRFMFPNVLFEPAQTFRAGFPDEYPVGDVSERWKDKHGVWIVRDTESMYALSTVCTHLGCTPNWLANDNKFKCPCHGSGFFRTGINFEGPAPRPLERFKIYLADDGEIVVDKTKKYQQEKGEWKDPESFVAV